MEQRATAGYAGRSACLWMVRRATVPVHSAEYARAGGTMQNAARKMVTVPLIRTANRGLIAPAVGEGESEKGSLYQSLAVIFSSSPAIKSRPSRPVHFFLRKRGVVVNREDELSP
jgi:hypothetical protein